MSSVSFLGLASGTDWNSIIDQLMQVERRPLEQMLAHRNQLAFDQSVMNDVNGQLTKFSTTLSNLRFESTFLSRLVDVSNRGRVSATAEAGAAVGTYNVQVDRLASAGMASSGLGGSIYSKVANLSPTQNMGINSLIPYNDFQATRALSSTLIKDTQQAGQSGAEITAGDTITITGQLKDGSAVSGTFTFAGNSTDTLARLATTVAQVFQGEIASTVGSNGELTFIETDPSVAGDVTLNTTVLPLDLQFNDTDYSGSTLDFGIGNIVAGAAATNRRLVGTQVFTTAGAPELNAATDLALLDQVTSGALNNGDIIRITGTENDGSLIASTDFTYTGAAGGQTINDLLTTIQGAFTNVTASYANGHIVLTDNTSGTSGLTLSLEFVDQGAATEFEIGAFTVAEVGRDAAAQMITTGSFTVEGTGEHILSSSDGKAGRIRGTVTLADPSNTLSSYGITEFDMLSIDVDGAAGALDPVTITGLSEYSTLQELVDAINDQIPLVTAQLVESSGTYRFEIMSNTGGQDIRVYDDAAGILGRIVNFGATDLDSATNDLTNTFAATTDTDDVTIIDWFKPDNGGPMQRFAWTGDEGSPVQGLIGGIAINGGGGGFIPGMATIVTANSAELNTEQDMHSYLFGMNNIAVSPATSIPALDPSKTLAEAGFATTPENSTTNPLFHTDGFFTINGIQINVGDVNTMTVNEVLGRINTSGAGVTAFYDEANSRFYLRNNVSGSFGISLGGQGDTSNFLRIAGLLTTTGAVLVEGQNKDNISTELPLAQAGFTDTPSAGVFTINGTKITIDPGVDTLQEVMEMINNSGAGVTASYDSISDRFTLTQKLGSGSIAPRIRIGDAADTSNFLEAVQLTVDTTVPSYIGSVRQTALFSVNGVQFERNSNAVDDVIEKVTLNLNSVTDGNETVTISSDTERIQDAILDFLVNYNETMEMLNQKPLSKTERKYTETLTEEDAATMSYDEIDEYILRREQLLIRDFVANDSSIRDITRKLQNLVTGPISNSGIYRSISQIGLTTSEVGGGPDAAAVSQGRLLGYTSDRETLKALMEASTELMDAINSNPDDLFTMFGNIMESRYTHQGSRNLSSGIVVNTELSFTIGDGTDTAQITFRSGTYSQTALMNRINQQINNAGLSDNMLVYYDSLNQLNLRVTKTEGQSFLQLMDFSSGSDSMLDILGWQPGLFFGPDPTVSGGVARRTREYIENITGIGGIVLERIKEGGSFSRKLESYDEAITQVEYNLEIREQRLRDQFVRLETALSNLQNQSSAIESAIAAMKAQTGVGSNDN